MTEERKAKIPEVTPACRDREEGLTLDMCVQTQSLKTGKLEVRVEKACTDLRECAQHCKHKTENNQNPWSEQADFYVTAYQELKHLLTLQKSQDFCGKDTTFNSSYWLSKAATYGRKWKYILFFTQNFQCNVLGTAGTKKVYYYYYYQMKDGSPFSVITRNNS